MTSTKWLKLTSSSSSAEKITANNDLLLQILACLPVKSLLKFKCVSRHWLSLISNPHFSRRGFLPHSPCICGLFLQTCPNSTYQIDFINLHCQHSETLPSVGYPPDTKILQTSNGLLLCCDTPSEEADSVYSVYNPTTKQCVPLPPVRLADEIFRGVFLAFDPLKSTEYIVICVLQEETEQPEIKIEIYSSKNGNWKGSEARFGLEWEDGLNGGVFWNGGIHWYTDYRSYVRFDLDEEQFKEMPLPNPILDDWYQRGVKYFGESRGHLHLVEIYYPPSTQFDVWELKRDYSGWFLKYRVDLDELVREYPGMIRDDFLPWEANHYMFEILCVVESERGGESYMVLHIPGNIMRYDFKSRNVKKLCDFPPLADHRNEENAGNFYHISGFQYIESFVRL